jgi:hypothetical protein
MFLKDWAQSLPPPPQKAKHDHFSIPAAFFHSIVFRATTTTQPATAIGRE